jgi:hypothetical protein
MLERLGNVLYWLGAGFGAILLVVAAFIAVTVKSNNADYVGAAMLAVAGAISWLIARALCYILAAR